MAVDTTFRISSLTKPLAATLTLALVADGTLGAAPFLEPGCSWGLGVGVDLEAGTGGRAPGRWGWIGGTGSAAYVDPTRDLVVVLLTGRGLAGPHDRSAAVLEAAAAAVRPR
ncbi:serine hydrolase [Actinotalea sp. BY-33]|uniref:Serine hydrolase n=2 Tax=Actinotalea soli TaxID=2819234 RepID=A0A939LTD6_9CELL|nr:serine hydrolase [Actinotalea soli]